MTRRSLVLVGTIFCASPLWAQNQQQSLPPSVIRTTARLVQISCVVEGKGKASLPGLTAADFRLFDKKEEQPITGFSIGWSDGAPLATEALPPGYFTNRTGLGQELSPSATVILISHADLPNLDEHRARKQLLKFLATVQPWERIALYTLEGGLRVLHDFTSDPAQLAQALEKYQPEKKKRRRSTLLTGGRSLLFQRPGWQDPFLEYQRQIATAEERSWAFESASALEAIAQRMARFPGRKNLVWVTTSVPFELPSRKLARQPGTMDPLDARLERLARTLQEANISVYPVNPIGIQLDFSPSFSSGGIWYGSDGYGYGYGYQPSYSVFDSGWSWSVYSQDFTNERSFADRTGGRAFVHSNDIAGALRRALNDARRTYVLGFYPAHNKWDGSFRKVNVKLVGKPGWKPRCRQGYYALPDSTPNQQDGIHDLARAVASPLESTGLAFDAFARLSSTSGGDVLEMQLRVEARDLILDLRQGSWAGALQLVLVEFGADGRITGNRGEELTVEVPADRFDQLQKDGLKIWRNLVPQRLTTMVRVILRDSRGSRLGSITIPLSSLASAR